MVDVKKGKPTGVKKPLKLEEIWRIRTRLEIERNVMQLALLNLAIDCKLRACDLLHLKVHNISSQGIVYSRVTHTQQKTGVDVQFEITSRTQQSLSLWLHQAQLLSGDYLFPSQRLTSNSRINQ